MLLRNPRNVGRPIARQNEARLFRPPPRGLALGELLVGIREPDAASVSLRIELLEVDPDFWSIQGVVSIDDVGQVFVVVGAGQPDEVVAAVIGIGPNSQRAKRYRVAGRWRAKIEMSG